MKKFNKVLCMDFITLLFLFFINISFGYGEPQLFSDEEFSDYSIQQSSYSKFNQALSRLKNSPKWVQNWMDSDVKANLGQVSAVTVDKHNNVHVFHRASNQWDASSFDFNQIYQGRNDPPISEATILIFNSNGSLIDMWGQELFYLPHGLAIDNDDNIYVTDVALHQVMRFSPSDRKKPNLILGTRFEPASDDTHYCKPSAVTVESNGDFFVADGYCNTRIIKYSKNGAKILQWGRPNPKGVSFPGPYSLFVPHALALAENLGILFVADRENGRIQSFYSTNGTFVTQYHNWMMGTRIFSVAYSNRNGGLLYIVNGPTMDASKVRGFVIQMTSGKVIQHFAPSGNGLTSPHDVAVSPDGREIYVVELSPHAVYKFIEDLPVAKRISVKPVVTKPTATIEWSETASMWGGAWVTGGVGAMCSAAALALCLLARVRTRNNGTVRNRRQQRWEYNNAEFKLQRLLGRSRQFTRVATDDSDDDATALTTNTHTNNISTANA